MFSKPPDAHRAAPAATTGTLNARPGFCDSVILSEAKDLELGLAQNCGILRFAQDDNRSGVSPNPGP
jgi:hypothetical protein